MSTSADPLATGSDQPVERVPALFALGSYLRRGRASDDARRLFWSERSPLDLGRVSSRDRIG